MTNPQKKRKTVPLLDLDKNGVVKLEAQGEELIPGISNEITLNHVLTKQPWRDFCILSSVNRSWLQAIRSHEVYEARVRYNSAESLAVVAYYVDHEVNIISLYSVRDERFYDVPPIPQFGGIPARSECVSLDGKLYVLGGVKNYRTTRASAEVYVLDLAGQRGWRRCASMQHPRHSFGCGALNGKIYVCGGYSYFQAMRPEVYDPEVDAWSPLPPMLSWRFEPHVKTFGEQLIVLGGNVWDPLSEGCLEVYNPIEEEWKFVKPGSEVLTKDLMFTKERIYSITWSDIHVQEGQDRWTHLHSLSSESSVKSLDAYSFMPSVPVVVDNELLTLLCWAKSPQHSCSNSSLVRSRGFCSGKKEIVWEDASWSRSEKSSEKLDGFSMTAIMCTIRL